jgi:plastocyanin
VLALAGMAVLTGACAGGTAGPSVSIPEGALEVRAVDMAFAPTALSAPADQPFALVFDNADSVPHNLVILSSDGSRVVASDVFTGAAVRLLQVPALAAGSYRLHCDIHPEMRGDLEAALGASIQPDADIGLTG